MSTKKYYDSQNNEVDNSELLELSEILGISTEAAAEREGYTTNFQTDPLKKNGASAGSSNTAPNGDLGSVNTSSASQGDDSYAKYYVTAEDLKQEETEVVKLLNKKLSRLGLVTSPSTAFGSFDAININTAGSEKVQMPGAISGLNRFFEETIGNPMDMLTSIAIGADKTDEELKKAVERVNNLIKGIGDQSFLSKAKEGVQDKYDKYSEYIKPDDISNEEASEKMKAEFAGSFGVIKSKEKDTINQTSSYAGLGGYVEEGRKATEEDFASKSDFDLYNKWNETGIIRDFTEDEIRVWDTERKNKIRKKKSSEYVNDLEVFDRTKIYALAAQDEEDVLNFNKQYEEYSKTAKSLDEAITNLEGDKTQENYGIAKDIQTRFIKEQESLQATQSKAVDSGLLDRANTLPYALQDLGKNYNRLNQLRTGFKSLGADIGFGAIQIVDTMISPEKLFTETTLGRNQRIEDTYGIVGLGSDLIKETESYQTAVQVDEIRSVKDAGRWVAGSMPNLVPSLAMAFTGPAAMPLFFLSGAGGKGMTIAIDQQQAYGRLLENRKILDKNPNIDGFEKMFIEQQMEKDAKVVNISNIQAIGTQVLYGAAEVAFEKVGTMSLLKGVSKGVKDLPGVTIKEGFKFAGKQLGKALYKEGGSEFATTFVQNFGDRFILGEDKNLFEGGLESFAQGALMGGGFGAAVAGRGFKQAFVSSLATEAEMAALKDVTNKLKELTGDNSIQGPSSLDGVNIDSLYEPEIASAIKDLVKEGKAKEDGVMFKLGSSLSIGNAKKVDDINLEITEANKRFAQAAANPNVKAAELAALEKQTRQKIDNLYEAREKILTNESSIAQTESNAASQAVYFESSSGYQMYSTKMLAESFAGISLEYSKISEEERQQGYDEAKIALQKKSKDGKQSTAEEIKKEARRRYKVKAYKTRINQGRKNAEKFAEDKDLGVEFIVAEGDTAAEQMIEAYETHDSEKLDAPYAAGATMTLREAIEKGGLIEGSAIKNGPIIINLEVAAENGRTGIFAHEVLHVYAKKIIGKENADLNAAGKVLLDYLEKNQPDLYAKVKFRIDQSYTVKDAEGKEVKSTAYYEEAMNAMSDVLADGQKVDESTIDKIRLFVNKLLPASMAFKKTEGESVYYFLKDFNKSSHFGGKTVKNPVVKVTTPEEDKDKTTEESNKLSITVDSINEQMDELVEKLNDDAIDFDAYNSQMESLEAKLEAAERGEVTKAPGKTIEVFHGGAVKTVNDIDGNIYFSEDKKLAEEYAKGSSSEVQSFKINEAEIATEAQVFEVIRELNIQPTIEGWTVDDSRLYELIDDRFDNAFTKEDLSKLNEALAAKGIKAARFTDTDLTTGKDTKSIVLFDKSAVDQETKPKPKAKPVSTAKTEERTKERKDKKQIGDALNDMIPANMTSAEWTNVAGKIIVKLQDGMLFPLVKKMAARMGIVADNVYGKTFQEFYDEVIGVQLVKNIMGFKPKTEQNPNGNDDFGGYLIGSQAGISNRIKEALIKFKKQSELSQADDITTAKGIAAEQETAPTLDEKSKYKNLLQQKVLSTEGLKKVRSKMITIVRVLKSKLDTVISKNVSTSPIINEIRLAAGKQLDLTFKEEMGGKKNLQLRNWTIENKQAIVENATTTWLMGKDAGSKVQGGLPIAIEKSVDGKFLPYPEWVGKKIDRETTEGRGQTSGNQIVRRAKSANINDAEFADFITKENGAPIPGRKEALAKMLAEETAFDLLKLDMETDGPVFEALKANQEALGTVITEAVKQEVSRQIERGNIKFSIGQSINEGIDILADNQADTSSLTVQAWLTDQTDEVKKYWDKYVVPAFAKLSTAVKSEIKNNLDAYKDRFPELAAAYDGFAANVLDAYNLKKNAKATADLQGFQAGFSRAIGNLLNSIPGFNILGSSTRSGELNEETRNNIKQEPKLGAYSKSMLAGVRAALPNVIVFNMGTKPVNSLLDFITSNLKSGGLKMLTDLGNSAIGKRMAAAKVANAVLFKFVNTSALESVLDSSNVVKAYEGFLRWLESNNNNSTGLKGLGFLQGIEVVDNQSIFTAVDGKKYYSRGGLRVVTAAQQSSTGAGLVVNTKHTNWGEAKAFLKKKGYFKDLKSFATNKKYDGIPEGEKLEFVENIIIAEALKATLEHQKSMGKVAKQLQVAAAGATVEWINSKKTAEDKSRIMQEFEQRVGQIHSDFGLVFNSAFISQMQNNVLGQTNELDTVRLMAAPKKQTKNILDVNTGESLLDPAVTKLKKEIESKIIDDIAKAQELSSENEGNSLSISKESAKLNLEFNEMIARQKGVTVDAEYSKIVAKRMGAKIGKYKLYIPSSAEDFRLLTGYAFSGKGKQGTADMKWFEDNLIRPYTKAIAAIDKAKQTTKNDFKALNKAMPDMAKTIGDLIPSKDYTNDQAVRVYLWNKAGYNIPGLNQKEIDKLVAYVTGNPRLALYADALLAISKSKKWLKPGEHWDVQTILSDINNLTEKGGRKAYLANWIENVDAIFSETSMNKIEALYGKRHREALEDALYRMKNGTNRPSGANAQVNAWNTWLNNSIGSIMFFNRRSALLQLLSTTNFLNWSDNNPVNAAKAFANQKQYWADFSYIFNSDKLKQRRGGLRADVNEAEIANAAANSKNKATAALSWLLKKGFTPTQIADSFAIASGGATFYRNRINTYVAQGMDVKEAEKKAWLDFIETSDQAQQSGDPSLVSMEQASILGRMVLAFQNTTQQYSRLMKRSGLDIINRRQMPGTKSMFQSDAANFSKIMYYGALQNLIFASLSAGLFALIPGFGDNEDEEERNKSKEEKTKRIFNSSVDSLIRGMGVRGAAVITIKNVIQEYFRQAEKKYRADHAYTILQAINLSPPIGSKLKKLYSAIKGYQYDKDVIEERGLDLTANGKLNLSPTYRVLGSLSAGALNLPLDRIYSEIQGIAEMLDERNTIYQRLALALGFRSWDVNAKNEEDDLIKLGAKDIRKKEGAQKSKKTREDNRVARKQKLSGMSILERTNFLKEEKEKRKRKRNK